MAKLPRLLSVCLVCATLLIAPTLWALHRSHSLARTSSDRPSSSTDASSSEDQVIFGDDGRPHALPHLMGDVVMPHLPNATAKAELGRAAWKVLHTMAQRFPESPRPDEREALRQYLYLFARLYPCGECAAHFQAMLKDNPPQTSSRNAASMYLCSLHNRVNERLGKAEFDCSTLPEIYDCGCGDPSASAGSTATATTSSNASRLHLVEG